MPTVYQTQNFKVKEKKNDFSFEDLDIIGEYITFIEDDSIKVKVKNDKEVEFEGKNWKLTTLTKELKSRMNALNESKSYRGPYYWAYDGTRLTEFYDS